MLVFNGSCKLISLGQERSLVDHVSLENAQTLTFACSSSDFLSMFNTVQAAAAIFSIDEHVTLYLYVCSHLQCMHKTARNHSCTFTIQQMIHVLFAGGVGNVCSLMIMPDLSMESWCSSVCCCCCRALQALLLLLAMTTRPPMAVFLGMAAMGLPEWASSSGPCP